MNDPSIAELIQRLPKLPGPGLWLADESHYAALPLLRPFAQRLTLISNRYDVAKYAESLGLECTFNDWLFPSKGVYQNIFLRICKEKLVNRHLLNQALLHLEKNGRLLISGEKNDGIKSFWQEAVSLFQQRPPLEKCGSAYVSQLSLTNPTHEAPQDNTYHSLQKIGTWAGRPIYSKPGVYGWDKIDQGSALLIEQLKSLFADEIQFEGILDLGCGYGFLTLAAAHLTAGRRVATDNNAAALECMRRNAEEWDLQVATAAGDCGDTVTGRFDLILCNPPFHRGFDVDGDLTRRFLQAAHDKLAPGGSALFVVNSFIPIERKTQGLFRQTTTLVNDRQFKVLRLMR